MLIVSDLDGTLLNSSIELSEYSREIMPRAAAKGSAVKKLKEILNVDKIISFGDAVNDVSMFRASDACYAVDNAAEELKKYASGIIPSNDNDGVARWLSENYKLFA